MNKIYTSITRLGTVSLLLFLLSALTLVGQTPTTFNYQAVLRDATGHIQESVSVSVQLVIHQGTATGTTVYSEVHNTTTTEFGIVNLEIGSVTPASFATIDWAAGPYFVEVIVNGTSMGTSELLTVPYALYAVNGVPGPQGDPGPQGEVGPEGPPGVISENSVGTSHVIDNSLTADDLGVGSVGSSEVIDNSLTADDLAENSVGSSEVTDNSLEAIDIAADAIGPSELANNSVASANVIDNSLAAADLAPNSVGASELAINSVYSADIVNGTIANADISTSAAIAASKIFGDAGVEYVDEQTGITWNAGEYDTRTLATITMTLPTAGYVILMTSGHAYITNQDRAMYVGVGTSATTWVSDIPLGYLTGTGTEDYYLPYTTIGVAYVGAGTRTFYALGRGVSTSSAVTGMLRTDFFVGIFIPKRY